MLALDRKLFRDLWAIKTQALAISCVIAAGVAMLVMALCSLDSLTTAQQTYYRDQRFADVFVDLKRAPRSEVRRLEQIPGVGRIQPRIVLDVTLQVEDLLEPATARLISIPDQGRPLLNSVHLRQGRWIEPYSENEILLSESFAEAHQLKPGDRLTAVINGRFQPLRIVGIGLSPEFVIQIPPGNLLPDDRRFAVAWMSERQLEAAYDMKGACNNINVSLRRDANSAEVIKQLDDRLERYGSLGAYDRSRQVSHQFLSDELLQLKSMAIVAPTLFLGVAAFLLNVVISRIIGLQREQIAALKAFGYSNWQVGVHYLKLVMLITGGGVLLGSGFGIWLARGLTRMYSQFYRFPVFHFEIELSTIVAAAAVSSAAAILGTWSSLRRASRLPPAEAMRPEPPASFRPTLVERLGIGALLPQPLRMILRKLERRPGKATLNCLGIAMAVAVLILGSFSLDAVTYIMDFQFRRAQRQDVTVTFVEPQQQNSIYELQHLPGAVQVEPFLSLSTRLRNGHRSRRVGIMGFPSEQTLFRVFDTKEQEVTIPEDGLMLSDKLASLLHVTAGDLLEVEVLQGKRRKVRVPVSGVIREYSGTNAYMNLDALNRLLQEGQLISGAFLKTDRASKRELYGKLKEIPTIAGVTVKAAALESFEQTIAENLLRMRGFNILFAAIIAFGVVYNSARISLSEQSRELATLRVIGFTRLEVSAILLGEIAVLTVLAIPLGCLLGYLFAAWSALGLDTETYRIPVVVNPTTYAYAIITVAVATLISGLIVRRRIDKLDLVSVLKTKE